MDLLAVGVFVLVVGIYRLYLNYKLCKDPAEFKKYLEASHKAWLWKKVLGVDKTDQLMRSVFLPAGTLLALLLILIGVGSILLSI